MVEVKIDKKRDTNILLTLSGGAQDIAKETAIMLDEICKAISNATDDRFDRVLKVIVDTAKSVHYSRG